ncbi:MOSC domain-containing protein [Limobrevibacterium gyesilva]|uniref:MOSC domain-containing protein n=1 Tax=Limobrevibacterium gyesilva TaxID=2991712 RepID=A0AA41YJH5_9PROT|nr:MOSC domain-containing protein [Limobrevibacterium gyesilva]MCW3474339.1 MOSC domain-containing protein [Limobrevibacterium gyesilva]
MSVIGHVESLWRYPVKSMRGEKLQEAYIAFSGVYGDRLYAFRNPDAPAGFPYLTGRELAEMLLYRPRFRDPALAARPPNLAEAESLAPGLTPVYPAIGDLAVDVETPAGDVLAIDDPTLRDRLRTASGAAHGLALLRSDRAMTDCRPVSFISLQTVRGLGQEVGMALDQRRFRANIYADLGAASGFTEDGFVGRSLRIGAKAVVALLERDPRCKMITLDPDTAQARPEVLRNVAQAHDGKAGVYGAVLVEGTVRPGDEIALN